MGRKKTLKPEEFLFSLQATGFDEEERSEIKAKLLASQNLNSLFSSILTLLREPYLLEKKDVIALFTASCGVDGLESFILLSKNINTSTFSKEEKLLIASCGKAVTKALIQVFPHLLSPNFHKAEIIDVAMSVDARVLQDLAPYFYRLLHSGFSKKTIISFATKSHSRILAFFNHAPGLIRLGFTAKELEMCNECSITNLASAAQKMCENAPLNENILNSLRHQYALTSTKQNVSDMSIFSQNTIDLLPNSTASANCCVDTVLESSCTDVYTAVLRSVSPRTSLAVASLERGLIDSKDVNQAMLDFLLTELTELTDDEEQQRFSKRQKL